MISEYVLNNFLKKDQERAQRELDCYGYCLNLAIKKFMDAEFEKAAAYHENITRSLKAIEDMKENKLATDQAAYFLGQIKAREQQDELLNRLRYYG